MKQNLGEQVNIKLFKKDENGAKEYIGELKQFDEQNIIISQDEKEVKIERKNRELGKLEPSCKSIL